MERTELPDAPLNQLVTATASLAHGLPLLRAGLAFGPVCGPKRRHVGKAAEDRELTTSPQAGSTIDDVRRDWRSEELTARSRFAQAIASLRAQRQENLWRELIYVSRFLTITSLPYRPTTQRQISKSCRLSDGTKVTITYSAMLDGVALPYGSDRTLLHWLLDKLSRNLSTAKTPEERQAASYVEWTAAADYLNEMGMNAGSGKNISDTRARWLRVSGLGIGIRVQGGPAELVEVMTLIDRAVLPSSVDSSREHRGQQRLEGMRFGVWFTPKLVALLMQDPVPTPKELLRSMRKQSQLQDFVLFLTWRSYAAMTESLIPWSDVREQLWQGDGHEWRVKTRFAKAISVLRVIWPELQAEARRSGLWIAPPESGIQFLAAGAELKRVVATEPPRLRRGHRTSTEAVRVDEGGHGRMKSLVNHRREDAGLSSEK